MSRPRILRRILVERFTEPLHLNLLGLSVAVFGSYRLKVAFDLILRPYHAYGILIAADRARAMGKSAIHVLELGVAAGAGLMNMSHIAAKVQRITGVHVHVVGFDTGQGMPKPIDYRDHPDHYWEGCFTMDAEALRARLPGHARLVLGDLDQTVDSFLRELSPDAPIGYVAVDVDYYSSAVKAFKAFTSEASQYLPVTYIYLDDIMYPDHNNWCGELLAVNEFNGKHKYRKIEQERFIRTRRIMKNAPWLDQMFILHVLDHSDRQSTSCRGKALELPNPFL